MFRSAEGKARRRGALPPAASSVAKSARAGEDRDQNQLTGPSAAEAPARRFITRDVRLGSASYGKPISAGCAAMRPSLEP